MVECSVLTVLQNHVYRFGVDIFHQQEGGAIGSHLTGSVERVVMDQWVNIFSEKLKENNLETYLAKNTLMILIL